MSGAEPVGNFERADALRRLSERYQAIAGNEPMPGWAYPLCAPVPFVGEKYGQDGKAPRILIYASAENIKTQIDWNDPWLADGNPGALHRFALAWRGETEADARTRVGIAPYEDGPLLAAAALLWRWEVATAQAAEVPPSDPVELTERVAVANFSKFAIPPVGSGRKNIDASAEPILRDSLGYVFADIDILRPSIVLVAKALTPALVNEVVGYAAHRGATVVYTLQGSGQGPRHAATHLERMGAADAFDLREALGEGFEPLWAFPGRRKDLTLEMWTKWFALLRARYLSATRGRIPARRSTP